MTGAVFCFEPEDLDPLGDYLAAVDDDNAPEPEDIAHLLTGGGDLNAGTIVGAARTLAAAARALAAAVADPYGLRTVNDVGRVVDAIGDTVEALLGETVAGLIAWLTAAEQRGEVDGPAGPAVEALVRLSGRFGPEPAAVPGLPGDASPGMGAHDVVAEITTRLRAAGVPTADPVVAPTGASWQIGDDLSLSLSGGFGGWGLFEPSPGEPGVWRGVVGAGLPSATYAHPGLVAERVAAFWTGRGVATCGAHPHPDTV